MVLNCRKVDHGISPPSPPPSPSPVTIISAKWRMYAARKRYRKLRWAGESRLCVSICQRRFFHHMSVHYPHSLCVYDLSSPSHLVRHSLEETDYSALRPEIQSRSCHCQKVNFSFVITSFPYYLPSSSSSPPFLSPPQFPLPPLLFLSSSCPPSSSLLFLLSS